MLTEAGFGYIEVIDLPRPQNCIYISRPADDATPEK
jgi:hypothetical protein